MTAEIRSNLRRWSGRGVVVGGSLIRNCCSFAAHLQMRAGGRMGDAKVFENGDRDSGRPMVFLEGGKAWAVREWFVHTKRYE